MSKPKKPPRPTDEYRRLLWQKCHKDNPNVYRLFCKFTFEAIARGRTHLGARLIWERIRWHTTIETTDPDFKLNDWHTPHYARLFMRDYPEHDGLFEIRGVGVSR